VLRRHGHAMEGVQLGSGDGGAGYRVPMRLEPRGRLFDLRLDAGEVHPA
jgi:hypothetical protein